MSEETPMRKLPEKKVWATIKSMVDDLSNSYETMRTAYAQMNEGSTFAEQDFLHSMVEIRVLSDEILRWKLL